MSDTSPPREALLRVLRLTAEEEIDCGRFSELLAALVDGGLTPREQALVEHHRVVCPECEEEITLLLAALGR